ncbi:MAG: HAD family acid phosphatase [Candidatus Marinimicrobia bacterium]|nr:HAD family acid phosphatase [Candidatus Neomarinimicrobiota bacterium]
MNKKYQISIIKLYIISLSAIFAQNGILNVGFDIDDTVLFSRDVFLSLPDDKQNPTDFSWINSHDNDYSIFIEPVVELIDYFSSNGHNVYFITARPGPNGKILAEFLTAGLGFPVVVNKNLFFSPKQTINGKRFTTKHRLMKRLKIDLFYGDSDTDMIAALKAGVHPVRVVRNEASVIEYGSNYFGNTLKGDVPEAPFSNDDLKIFYKSKVGIFGESIYPIIWNGLN